MRTRTVLGPAERACGHCQSTDVVLVRSANVRRLRDRLDPSWRTDERLADTCRACGWRTIRPHAQQG